MQLDFTKAILNDKDIVEGYGNKQIYEYYLGEKLSTTKFYNSPIRTPSNPDNNPSLTFFKPDYKTIIFTDWGTSKTGDVYDFVREYYKVRNKNLKYNELLKQMVNDLQEIEVLKETIPYLDKKRKFGYRTVPMEANDITYWKQYGISYNTLYEYNVKRVQEVYDLESGITQFYYKTDNPIYAYEKLGDSGKSFQLYRPYSTRDRKFKNGFEKEDTVLFGLEQLPDFGKLLVITKSMKDVMCFSDDHINSIGVPSEGYNIPEFHILDLKARFSNIIILYDNDATGYETSSIISKRHGFESKFVPALFKIKDYSDYRKFSQTLARDFAESLK